MENFINIWKRSTAKMSFFEKLMCNNVIFLSQNQAKKMQSAVNFTRIYERTKFSFFGAKFPKIVKLKWPSAKVIWSNKHWQRAKRVQQLGLRVFACLYYTRARFFHLYFISFYVFLRLNIKMQKKGSMKTNFDRAHCNISICSSMPRVSMVYVYLVCVYVSVGLVSP